MKRGGHRYPLRERGRKRREILQLVDARCMQAEPFRHTQPLGGRSSVGLVVTGDRDVALTAAGFTPPRHLWPNQSQQTISWQGAGDCWLVNTGGEAVAAVKLTRDVTMVILKNSGVKAMMACWLKEQFTPRFKFCHLSQNGLKYTLDWFCCSFPYSISSSLLRYKIKCLQWFNSCG